MNREQVEERKWFAPEEKDFILSKSHGRCCHCGKKISVGKDFTVEHVIPLSKGGTNNISNIVALCKDCNDAKQDRIIEPEDYLKYLDDMYKQEVIDNQNKYYEEYNWFSQRNFIPVDKRTIDIEVILPFKSHKKKSEVGYKIQYTVDKATYADLNNIYEYIWRYNQRYGINTTREHLKESVSDIFCHGAFYIVQSKSKELAAVIPVALTKTDILDNKDLCLLSIKNPICLYNKEIYIQIITECILEIITGASEQSFVTFAIPVKFEKCINDPVATEIYRLVGGNYGAFKFGNDKFEASIILMNKNCGDDNKDAIDIEDSLVRQVDEPECTDTEFFRYIKEFSSNILESLDTNINNILDW